LAWLDKPEIQATLPQAIETAEIASLPIEIETTNRTRRLTDSFSALGFAIALAAARRACGY